MSKEKPTLEGWTTAALEAELERRKMEHMPTRDLNPSWGGVLDYMEETMIHLHKTGCLLKDFEQGLFEEVVGAMYEDPEKFWEWFNRKLQDQ